VAYVIWYDQFREHVLQERLVTATIAAAGGRGADGRPVEITDVDSELENFDRRLAQSLDHERIRAAILREVSR
jgi:hypothetical protein